MKNIILFAFFILASICTTAGIVEDFFAIRNKYAETREVSFNYTHSLYKPGEKNNPFIYYEGIYELSGSNMYQKLGAVEVFSSSEQYVMLDHGIRMIVIADPQPIEPMPVNTAAFIEWIVDWTEIPAIDGHRGYKVQFSRYFDNDVRAISFFFDLDTFFFTKIVFHYKKGVKTDNGEEIGRLEVRYSDPSNNILKAENKYKLSNFVTGSKNNLQPTHTYSNYEIQDSRNSQ